MTNFTNKRQDETRKRKKKRKETRTNGWTDKQKRDRKTYRQMYIQTDLQTDVHTDRERDRERDLISRFSRNLRTYFWEQTFRPGIRKEKINPSGLVLENGNEKTMGLSLLAFSST
jgi:hypothetical protein